MLVDSNRSNLCLTSYLYEATVKKQVSLFLSDGLFCHAGHLVHPSLHQDPQLTSLPCHLPPTPIRTSLDPLSFLVSFLSFSIRSPAVRLQITRPWLTVAVTPSSFRRTQNLSKNRKMKGWTVSHREARERKLVRESSGMLQGMHSNQSG